MALLTWLCQPHTIFFILLFPQSADKGPSHHGYQETATHSFSFFCLPSRLTRALAFLAIGTLTHTCLTQQSTSDRLFSRNHTSIQTQTRLMFCKLALDITSFKRIPYWDRWPMRKCTQNTFCMANNFSTIGICLRADSTVHSQ